MHIAAVSLKCNIVVGNGALVVGDDNIDMVDDGGDDDEDLLTGEQKGLQENKQNQNSKCWVQIHPALLLWTASDFREGRDFLPWGSCAFSQWLECQVKKAVQKSPLVCSKGLADVVF